VTAFGRVWDPPVREKYIFAAKMPGQPLTGQVRKPAERALDRPAYEKTLDCASIAKYPCLHPGT